MATDDSLENQIKASVHSYLLEDKWKVTPAQGQITWAFVAEDSRGRKIVVGQQQDRRDAIFIQSGLTLSDDWRARLSNMESSDKSKLLWDVRFALLRMEPEFSGVDEDPKRITFNQRIFFDGLTKDLFFQRVSQVRKSLLTAWWILGRALSANPTPDEQVGD